MSNKVSTINIFNQCVKELEKSLNSTEINSWIKPLKFDLKENNFNIYAPNNFVGDLFKEKYLPQITTLLEDSIGRNKFILNVSVETSTQTHINGKTLTKE